MARQQRTQAHVGFLIDKTKLLDRLRGDLDQRQMAVLLRQEEIKWLLHGGFKMEFESLITKDISYVTEEYTPQRLKDEDFRRREPRRRGCLD